jgi:hypothetical protein
VSQIFAALDPPCVLRSPSLYDANENLTAMTDLSNDEPRALVSNGIVREHINAGGNSKPSSG